MKKAQVINELKALKEVFEEERNAYPICLEEAIRLLEQPEIIYCKDCKKNPHWEWVGCPMTGRNTRKPNDFCSYAERRTDE